MSRNPALLGVLGFLSFAVPLSGLGQQEAVEGIAASPRLSDLARRVADGEPEAEARFWTRAAGEGTPVVETLRDAPGHSLVSFVFRGDPETRAVRLESNLNALLIDGIETDLSSLGSLRRIPGSDVWYRSFRLRNDLRVPYRFEVIRGDSTPHRVLDPSNPVVWEPEESSLAASVLELPGAPPQPWRASSSEEGDWDEWEFEGGPDAGRTVYIYKPLGWDVERPDPYPVLVGLGAYGHGIGMRVDRIVDHLVWNGRLAPLVVALADLEPGSEETRYEATAEFVVERFLPWLRDRYGVTTDPRDVVVSGTSRRGMVASLVAARRPDAVGNVLSLSGSFYWRPPGEVEYGWVPRLYATTERRPIRFFVAAGELETVVTPRNAGHYLVGTNRHFRDVLASAGYRLAYREFNGVHSELNWQDWLAEGLVHLLGPAP